MATSAIAVQRKTLSLTVCGDTFSVYLPSLLSDGYNPDFSSDCGEIKGCL